MTTYANFTRVQTLLYYFASFIGLAPFSVENNILRPVRFLRKAYAVILAILSSLWIYFVFFYGRDHGIEATFISQFTHVLLFTLFGGNLWVTLLIFAFKSNEMSDIINRIAAIKSELKNLGIEDICAKNCKNFYARIITTNGVILLLRITFDSAIYDNNHNHGTAFLASYWIGRIIIAIHIHSAILIFVETMICIRQLFESLNNKLQGTVEANSNYLSSDKRRNSSVLEMGRHRRIADQVARPITTVSGNIQLSVEDVENIGKLHGELCDLVESTTHFHTVSLLFAIVRNFSYIISSWYSLYVHVFISHGVFETIEAELPWTQQLMVRTTTTMLELFLIAHASTSVSRVGNATKAILHETWNKYYPEELRDELVKFSLQLLHKPVTVSAFGFFDLGYSYLYKMFCTLVAYFIIMIQLDTSQSNPRT